MASVPGNYKLGEFGHIPGYPPGTLFENRADLAESRVHKHPQAGISGGQYEGAESIVLSGGYEDDTDYGDEIIYTGHGGRDNATSKQIRDQPFSRGNRALAYSKQQGLPVRVIRGSRHNNPNSPPAGYSYDGLYRVEDFWRERGRSGFYIWRFKLNRLPEAGSSADLVSEPSAEYSSAPRKEYGRTRLLRDAGNTRYIKELYRHRCQMCGTSLVCAAGPYAEAAHIRALGSPHNGPDTLENMLCLCPNHHVLFDNGGITIAEDLSLIGEPGSLMLSDKHRISKEHLRYHRNLRSTCNPN